MNHRRRNLFLSPLVKAGLAKLVRAQPADREKPALTVETVRSAEPKKRPKLWSCSIDGRRETCLAFDKSSARSQFKALFDLPRLPPGVPITADPC